VAKDKAKTEKEETVQKTAIEWVKNPDGTQGYTLNDKTGCTNHTPEGLCLGGLFPCYAFPLANGRLKPLYLANHSVSQWDTDDNILKLQMYNDPFYPRFWEEKLKQPYQRKKPAGIFLDDMSDWMGDCWPKEWTKAELQMMRDNPQHRFYTLTKQPQNLPQFSPFPDNCFVGVTATNQEMLIDALAELHRIEATIKYISFEPLLEAMNGGECEGKRLDGLAEDIDWLLIGACTGTELEMQRLLTKCPGSWLKPFGKKWTLQPPIEWVQEIVEAADQARIKVFLKDNLRPLFEQTYGQDIHSYYYHNGLKQEMPE